MATERHRSERSPPRGGLDAAAIQTALTGAFCMLLLGLFTEGNQKLRPPCISLSGKYYGNLKNHCLYIWVPNCKCK